VLNPGSMDTQAAPQIREHYELEKTLAARLRTASKEERRRLYPALYDELFRRLPRHPTLAQESSPEAIRREVGRQLAILGRFLSPETVCLEIGPGSCALALAVAERVRHVYGAEVSAELTSQARLPANFTLLATDGSSLDLPAATVNVVYSNQLMEHLHPADAVDQLQHIYRVLTPGGRYVCVTPNRLSGPWDVSRHFDRVATGFHLHEYTVGELESLLRAAGFRRIDAYVGARGHYVRVPIRLISGCERALMALPEAVSWRVAHSPPVRVLLGMRLVALK